MNNERINRTEPDYCYWREDDDALAIATPTETSYWPANYGLAEACKELGLDPEPFVWLN